MKKAIIIRNPNSGKKRNVIEALERSKKLFQKYGYEYNYMETQYKGHAKELVKVLLDFDLVISMGGDGTFNEIVSGNLEREKPLVVSHIPVGTANDLRSLFGLGKDIYNNINLILSGKDKQIDVCLINERPFVYVAGFGKFVNLSYETPRNKKKTLGYGAYITEAVKDFFRPINMVDIEFEIDGVKRRGTYCLGIISNANRIAGISGIYKDVKLDDDQFEVLLCSLKRRTAMVKTVVEFGINGIDKASGLEVYRTNNIKIKFLSKLRKPWTIDGEKSEDRDSKVYSIKINRDMKFRISQKAAEKNCVK